MPTCSIKNQLLGCVCLYVRAMGKWMYVWVWMDGCMDVWYVRWMSEWVSGCGCMDDGRMVGWMHGREGKEEEEGGCVEGKEGGGCMEGRGRRRKRWWVVCMHMYVCMYVCGLCMSM